MKITALEESRAPENPGDKAAREAERAALHIEVQTLLAGHTMEAAWSCAGDALAICIAGAAETIEEAERLCDLAAGDLKHTIRENWQLLAEQRRDFAGISRA